MSETCEVLLVVKARIFRASVFISSSQLELRNPALLHYTFLTYFVRITIC